MDSVGWDERYRSLDLVWGVEPNRYGGPQDPAVLYGPDDLVADLDGLVIERAERVTRQVSTEAGERTAIDVLVRVRRGRDGAKGR
ncbi:MAG: hypothetical protein ACYCZV_03770 [Acidimicrobiales bacterium]